MANEWYIQHAGKQYGPLTAARLKQLAAERKITPATSVRLGAAGNWVPASRVQGLFAPPPAAAPPSTGAPSTAGPTKVARKPSPSPPVAPDLLDDELPPLVAPPAPPPVASPLARVPIGAVAPAAKAAEAQGSMPALILGAIGLVFGILALATFWLPILNGPLGWTGIVGGGLGLLLAGTGLAISAMRQGSGLYLNIAGTSSAAVGLVLTVVLGITFGMFSSKQPQPVVVNRPVPVPVVEEPAPPPELPKEPEPPPLEIVWTDAGEAIDQPPIRAKIAGAAIEKIRLESSDLTTMKREPLAPKLRIRVTIENTSQDKIVEVPGWTGSGGLLGGTGLDQQASEAIGNLLKGGEAGKSLQAATAAAKLVDNVDNPYPQVPAFQVFGAKIAVGEDLSLRPGQSRELELVFPPPLATIEHLRLELAPGGFGGSEPLRFQIPKAMIAGM
jgi:hypothetical protein